MKIGHSLDDATAIYINALVNFEAARVSVK
jgi:hypothetical protein